jgi:hypothetical protein
MAKHLDLHALVFFGATSSSTRYLILENSLGSSTLGPFRYLVRWAGVQTRMEGDGCCGEKWVAPEAPQDVPDGGKDSSGEMKEMRFDANNDQVVYSM